YVEDLPQRAVREVLGLLPYLRAGAAGTVGGPPRPPCLLLELANSFLLPGGKSQHFHDVGVAERPRAGLLPGDLLQPPELPGLQSRHECFFLSGQFFELRAPLFGAEAVMISERFAPSFRLAGDRLDLFWGKL